MAFASNDRPQPSAARTVAVDLALLIAAFLVAEGLLRLLAPQPLHTLLRNVYEVREDGFRYRPGAEALCNNGYGDHHFAINSWGARDREYGPQQPGEWRLLCLGDSFSDNQALEVDEIYPNVLEARLNAERPEAKAVSVVNGGMAGWGLWDYHDYLMEMLARIRPDVVVVAVGAAGDLVKSARHPPPVAVTLRTGLPVSANASLAARIKWGLWYGNQLLKDHSHAYVALRRLTYYPGLWLGVTKVPRFSHLITDPAAAARVVEPTTTLLRQIKAVCEAHSVRLVILNVPRIYEVDADARRMKIELERPDLTQFDITRPARLLRAIATEVGIPLCDPTTDLAIAPEPTYFPEFAHWNIEGNRVVADGLRHLLAAEGLLPP